MKIDIAYGLDGLTLDFNANLHVSVIEPKYPAALSNPREEIQRSLKDPNSSPPLSEWISANDRVGIIFSDITRPVPIKQILPAILDEISMIDRQNIILFNATGTHRQNSEEELIQMLGEEIVSKYRIVQNDAFDKETHEKIGITSSGNPILINKELLSCDRLILTGFIEPHFFAGFSGGGKAIMPGMAWIDIVMQNHGPKMISNPKSTFGSTQGNPIWEEITEIGKKFSNSFLVNVSLNKEKEITGVFSGDLIASHLEGCSFVKETVMVPVERAFDIVITTNSGYPLDLNLYQAVKGMSAASRIVKKGGSIIIAAECRNGVPDQSHFSSLLKSVNTPYELLDSIFSSTEIKPDQWQAQIMAQILLEADVYLYSENLQEPEIRSALLKPCVNIEECVLELMNKYGENASICILPEGPQTIPYLVS